MNHRRLATVFGLALLAVSVEACKRTPPTTVLQREWTANAEFAGDVWAADIALQRGLHFEVREGSEVIDPVKLVRTGDVQFGVASADRILHENEGGADLLILAAACFRSPVVFLTHPSSGITSPTDFRGRTVGIQSGTNTELVFKSLLRAHNLTSADVKVVESGWGTTNFETNAIDVLAAFAYDEPVQLEIKHIPFETIQPEASGVRYVGTVYFTSGTLARESPDIIQAFMNNLVEGWHQALQHPQEAIKKASTRFTSLDTEKETLSLERGRTFFAGENGRLLYASRDRWEEMGRHLVELGVLKRFDFQANVDYRFLDAALQTLDDAK